MTVTANAALYEEAGVWSCDRIVTDGLNSVVANEGRAN